MTNKEVENRLKELGVEFEHYENDDISSWHFDSGEPVDKNGRRVRINTGDGGARMMLEAYEEAANIVNTLAEELKKELFGKNE